MTRLWWQDEDDPRGPGRSLGAPLTLALCSSSVATWADGAPVWAFVLLVAASFGLVVQAHRKLDRRRL